jgi:TonB family protein
MLAALVCILVCCQAQSNDSNTVAKDSGISAQDETAVQRATFFTTYDLNENVVIKSKMLGDTPLLLTPSLTSASTGISIPRNTILNAFKYFPDAKCWAVEYRGSFGFVRAESLMPVNESDIQNRQLYDEAPELKSPLRLMVPDDIMKQGLQGIVTLRCFINETGKVTQIEVVTSIPGLDQVAIDAVRESRFKPAKYQGKPIAIWKTMNVRIRY